MRRLLYVVLFSAVALPACGPNVGLGIPSPGGRPAGAIVVDDEDRGRGRGSGRLNVPPGHYPPPGECRVWFPGRPPGQQPPPARCETLIGRVPWGAYVLYNGRDWDTQYDWSEQERRNRGTVPAVILQLMRSVRP